MKNEHEIRNKLFGIISSDIKNSCLAEVMYGKRATSNKSTYILPPPLPLLVKNLASHINTSNALTHLHLSQEECNAVENATHTQSLNPVWYEQRKGRLTASMLYGICTRADTTLKKKDENVKKTEQPIAPTHDSISCSICKQNGIMYHVLITLQKINLIASNFLGFALYV